MVPLFVVVVVVVMPALFYLGYRSRQKRVAAVVALAQQMGFTYTKGDTDRMVTTPFALFRMGEGRGIELVISGRHNDLPLRLFDFWFYTESNDGQGHSNRDYHRFTCALLELPANCPALQLSHENAMTRIGEHLGLHDVTFEFDDFNRRFRVKCDDQKFAFSLFDAPMMEWMLGADSFDRLETYGNSVLLASKRLDPAAWPELVTWIDTFHSHVPPVLFTTYPPRSIA